MVELVIFVGLQGAGKSTFYRRCFASTHVLVSKDLLRNNRNRNRRQSQLISAALATGRLVVVDNTNPTLEDRQPLIELGRAYHATVTGYYFPPQVAASLVRNSRRVGRARVPDVAIFATAKKLVRPSYAEGFDKLWEVAIAADGTFDVRRVPLPDVGD